MNKQALFLVWLIAFVLMLWLGPMAWNYVAPLFGLPQLTIWQFFLCGFALRSMWGPKYKAES